MKNQIQCHAFSRKHSSSATNHVFDFADESHWPALVEKIRSLNPERIFYFAGGGPFGNFQDKNWKDHQWAWRVTFQCPAFLLHQFLQHPNDLRQFVFIGSAIAESAPDAQASSYCAAKHALKGLVTSVQRESRAVLDLRLFSPGYMDTDLLPAHAWPRQQADLVKSPEKIAEMLWAWIHNADDVNKHFV